jgi:hypothetical protein
MPQCTPPSTTIKEEKEKKMHSLRGCYKKEEEEKYWLKKNSFEFNQLGWIQDKNASLGFH